MEEMEPSFHLLHTFETLHYLNGKGMNVMVTLETTVEDLVNNYPQAIEYGIENGVSLVFCVGSFPATLGELLRIKKVADPKVFVDGLNKYLAENKRA